ncbi:hypothetical protein BVG16_01905 [Paenibacillus selenitireducens]|jgi:hypothetical protein|uniref:Signal transduction histidine kinase n=1 Tax=Paenibacillus selenitireducens TaxID=1324314 RepID=A0A1T2XMM9_9BACL|nr:hypothetical protein [Paenibacillus selenitireducens]OPA81117.1 hypothetical protein BVG16_01905 [Paenibacillus selenitireducens]
MDTTTILIFIVLAFSLGAILIMKKDSIPSSMRRAMAIITILLVAFAFFLIVYSSFHLGTT